MKPNPPIKTRVLNQPFGKFTVQGYDTKNTDIERGMWGLKIILNPMWRYLNVYGRFAYPWFEHATFDSISEAQLFAEWVNKEKVYEPRN